MLLLRLVLVVLSLLYTALAFAPARYASVLRRSTCHFGMKELLKADMKEAMKAKEKSRLAAIKAINSAIKQKEVDDRVEVTDDDVIGILSKLVKKGKESIQSYTDAGREDLAESEKAEVDTISSYLPAQLSDMEVSKLIDEAISAAGATDIKGMGKVMGVLRPQLVGKADIGVVSDLIKKRLNQ